MNDSSPLISKKLVLSQYNYFPGENIEGYLELEVVGELVIIDIYIDIFMEEKWTYNNDVECDKKKIMTFKVDSNSQFIHLVTGNYKFPFKYITSEEMKPSFEYYLNENNKAYIRYYVEAKVYSGTLIYNITNYLLIKARPIIDISSLSKNDIVHIYKFGFFEQGITEIMVTLPKNNFLLKNVISPKIIINNTRGKLDTDYFKIILSRKIILKWKNSSENINLENEITSQIIQAKVLNGAQKEYNANIIFSLDNIPNKKSKITYKLINDPNYLIPSVSGDIVSCEYSIQVFLYFEKSILEKYRPKVILPVYLVHQLPIDYQLEIQEKLNYEKILRESKNENKEENLYPSLEMIKEASNNKINDEENSQSDQSIAAPLANFGIVSENNLIKNNDNNKNNMGDDWVNINKSNGNNVDSLNKNQENICENNNNNKNNNRNNVYDINEI